MVLVYFLICQIVNCIFMQNAFCIVVTHLIKWKFHRCECKNSMLNLQNYFVSFKITYKIMVMNLNRKMIWSKLVAPSSYNISCIFFLKWRNYSDLFILVIASAILLKSMGKVLSLKIHAYDTVSDRMKMFSLYDLCGVLSWFC